MPTRSPRRCTRSCRNFRSHFSKSIPDSNRARAHCRTWAREAARREVSAHERDAARPGSVSAAARGHGFPRGWPPRADGASHPLRSTVSRNAANSAPAGGDAAAPHRAVDAGTGSGRIESSGACRRAVRISCRSSRCSRWPSPPRDVDSSHSTADRRRAPHRSRRPRRQDLDRRA